MTLPHTYLAALALLILAWLGWGSWANTYKLARNWRYELYYFDWMIGALLAAGILALTAGSLGYDGFSFRDDLLIGGKRQWLWAFLAGVLFNFGNMLLMACVSLAGMAVAFPIGAAAAIIVGAAFSFAMGQFGPPVFLLLGCALLAGGAVSGAMIYRHMLVLRHETIARAGKAKSTKRPGSAKALVLALVGGLLLGAFWPLIDLARQGEIGLGPYSAAFLCVFGALLSTLIMNLFLMNLPVEGEPLEFREYFSSPWQSHLLGVAGGAIWSAALIAGLAAVTLPPDLRPGPVTVYLLTHGWPVLAAVWGIFAWKEFGGADGRVKVLGTFLLSLFTGGLVLLAVAPLYLRH